MESIESRSDEFLDALLDDKVSEAAQIEMLRVIGVSAEDLASRFKSSSNLLYEWGSASTRHRPYCLLTDSQLLEKAKSLGVKSASSRWKRKTLMAKILDHEAAKHG